MHALNQWCHPKILRKGLFMENILPTPITIAVYLTTPFSYLSIPKVNINATYINCLKLWLKWK